MTRGWQEIPQHTLRIRGLAPHTAIVFVANEVIPRQNIAFDVSISLSEEFHVEKRNCDVYSPCVLDDFRRQLTDLRQGSSTRPTLSLTGLELTIYEHRRNVSRGVIVEAVMSNFDLKSLPWQSGEIADSLLVDAPTAHCLRFAFKTSLVDPPYVDLFLNDIDRLLVFLQDAEP